ncbi:MAG: hypothetical protein PUH30_09365, partial [Oscillospiraceae bacterium]|nr:hypothetical protein [Oscillospiraceae bacterium]
EISAYSCGFLPSLSTAVLRINFHQLIGRAIVQITEAKIIISHDPLVLSEKRPVLTGNASGYVNDITDKRLHHEIYMSDARKVAPEKWKTVIRHPIRKL